MLAPTSSMICKPMSSINGRGSGLNISMEEQFDVLSSRVRETPRVFDQRIIVAKIESMPPNHLRIAGRLHQAHAGWPCVDG